MEKFKINNDKVRLGAMFLVGLIVGLGVYWIFDNDDSSIHDEILVNEEVDTTLFQEENGLLVDDQVAGKTVLVDMIVFKRPGWVAIHDDLNGTPGRILGARVFDIGTTTEGIVELLRGTEGGKSYFAMLHDDDGKYKQFDPQTDKPLLDKDGKPIMVLFQVIGGSDTAAVMPTNISKE
jgi:hypothetical protein